MDLLFSDPDQEPVAGTRDFEVGVQGGKIRARAYYPSTRENLPAVLYFHGGGFVFGGLEAHDNVYRLLSRLSGLVVVSVEYRLAPENKFPVAVNDSYSALKYVADREAGRRPL
jgi:acetyl esterase